MKRDTLVMVMGCGLLSACGEVPADDAPAASLAEVRGTLQGTAPADLQGEMRVAIVWAREGGRSATLTTQDTAIEPMLPAGFRLALDAPPPAATLWSRETALDATLTLACLDLLTEIERESTLIAQEDIDACRAEWAVYLERDCAGLEGKYVDFCWEVRARNEAMIERLPAGFALGEGIVVAYEDRNGNGQLDMLPHDAKTPVDRILGHSGDLRVMWVEGSAPGLGEVGARPGFRLLDRTCRDDEDDRCETFLEMDTAITLTLGADDRDSWLMCADGNVRYWPELREEDDLGEGYLPGGTCSADGLVYTVEHCVAPLPEAPICGPRSCSSHHSMITDLATAPADWPCK